MRHLDKGGNDAVEESNSTAPQTFFRTLSNLKIELRTEPRRTRQLEAVRSSNFSLLSSVRGAQVLCLCSYIGVITMFRYATGPWSPWNMIGPSGASLPVTPEGVGPGISRSL